MSFLQNLSDDQTALLGCLAALIAAGLLMSVSYYIGNWSRSPRTVAAPVHRRHEEQKPTSRAA